jgi:hypothetical protein
MSVIARGLTAALSFLRRHRDDQLQWHLSRQDEVAELRQARALAEQAVAAQLKKQAQKLAYELAVAQTINSTDLEIVKTRCKQDLKDYQQYLQSLDKLKISLRNSYAHLPEAVAFTIHHHAKQLLNRMWEATDNQEKMKVELQLLQFMTAVHEDSQSALQSNGKADLPEKSLAFIDAESA